MRILAGLTIVFLLCINNIIYASQKITVEEYLFGEEEVKVATGMTSKGVSLKDSPGVVTLITEEEIKESGARDLIDVLRLVPGFGFGVDVEGVVSWGMRGVWAQEGKVLLMLDGQEMNDLLYAGVQFGNHFSVDQIKQIEIIRGPGSALYGGFAELGVVNIVTKGAREINGVTAATSYGRMESVLSAQNVNLLAGKEQGNFSWSALGFIGKGNRSDQDYTDFSGNTYSMDGNSELNPINYNVSLRYRDISTRVILDRYDITQRDQWGENLAETMKETFDSYLAELKYEFRQGNLVIVPRINYKKQIPWSRPEPFLYQTVAERLRSVLSAAYDITPETTIMVGAENFIDQARVSEKTSPDNYFKGGQQEVRYYNQAYYAQLQNQFPILHLTAGMRYDKHNEYGDSLVSRVVLTESFAQAHFKALYSESFRAPSIENIHLSEALRPEDSKVIEFETGYQFTKTMSITTNIFDQHIDNPIVYSLQESTDPGTGAVIMEEGYENFGRTGTRGIETEFRVKSAKQAAVVMWSLYRMHENQVDLYKVEGQDNFSLGFPMHKVTGQWRYKITPAISFSPSLVYLGKRFGYYTADGDDNPVLKEFAANYLLTLYMLFRGVYVPNLDIGVGVYDVFNERPVFIQPYNNGHAPLPGASREWRVKAVYSF